MAYQKRYKKRIYKKKRNPYSGLTLNNAMKTAALAKSAYYGVRYIKGLVNSEMLHNQGNSSGAVSSTGTMVHLTAIAQGDTSSGRTGNSILARELMIRIALSQNATATQTFYRFMLVQDTQQIGDTTPGVTDVLESASYLSPLATATAGRFKVLWSKICTTNNSTTTTMVYNKFFKIYSHVRYNGTAGADIQKGGYYLLLLSDQAVNTPTIFYQFKLGYHDN